MSSLLSRSKNALDASARLAALYQTGLLDSQGEEAFDRFTRLASRIVGAPVSLLSLVEHDRQFFKSAHGMPADLEHVRETGLDASFCQHVVTSGHPLTVPDALQDPLVRDNRAVTDLRVRAYLGVAVRSPGGEFVIGSLCAIDTEPHVWSEGDRQALEELSDLITTEIHLRASERRFRAFVEATSQVTFVASAQGEVTELRRSYPFDQSLSSDEADGWGWADALHPDDRDRVVDGWHEALRDRLPYATTHRRRNRDGTYHWTRSQVVPIFDDDRFIEFIGTCVDVDDAHQTRSDLERQTTVLQSFFDTVPGMMGVVEVHPDDVSFVIANAATQEFFANAMEAAPPRGSVRAGEFVPDALSRWVDAFHASIASGEPVRFEYDNPTAGGTARLSATVNPVGHTDGGVPLCSFAADDVTERRRAERQLAASERHLQMAVESAHIGVWEYDFETNHANWSAQTCSIHGAEAFDGRGGTAIRLLAEEDRAGVGDLMQQAMMRAAKAGAADVSTEYRVVVQGEERWVRTLGRVYAENGRPTHMSGVSQDVTSEKLHAQSLMDARAAAVEAQERAEEVARLKTNIIDNMSHEIRTPLTAILGFADLMAEEPGDPDPEIVGIIQASAQRLLDTLNSVLYYAQLESGVILALERADVTRIVRSAVHAYAARAQAKHLALHVSAPSDPVWTRTNSDALGRLVAHLVSNAVKFTHSGRIDVRVGSDDEWAWVEVADTGVGMGPAFVAKAFEPFQQESGGTTRAFEGIGLGLSIVRSLADRFGARLDVQSDEGVGSTLRVWLPMAPADAPGDTASQLGEGRAAAA